MIKVAVFPGDGIGKEVVAAALPIIEQVGLPWSIEIGEIGWECWRAQGDPVPDSAWKLIAESAGILLGAITSKSQQAAKAELNENLKHRSFTYTSPVIQLRQKLDLFANVRPIFSEEKNINITIIRENSEGLYSGLDFNGLDEDQWKIICNHPNAVRSGADQSAFTVRLQTKFAIERITHFAAKYALKNNFTRITLADKPTVLRNSGNFIYNIIEEVLADYPPLTFTVANIDSLALDILYNPEKYEIILAENMFGDILSDVATYLIGGLGVATSGNLGLAKAYFEPVHGSAPDIAGTNKANPIAMILSVAGLAQYLGEKKIYTRIHQAVSATILAGYTTPDLGGTCSTIEVARAITERLRLQSS